MNRSRFQIITEILQLSKHGSLKTHIMYKCELTFKQQSHYLPALIKRGLLTHTDKYRTTDKGLALLHLLEQVNALWSTQE